MTRSWIGLGLLAILLLLSLLAGWAMEQIHSPIAEILESAGEAALAGTWPQAEALLQQAEENWQRHRLFRACFADHGPMEEVDACFAQLKVFARRREETAFAASCAETARKTEAMGQAHSLQWENVL